MEEARDHAAFGLKPAYSNLAGYRFSMTGRLGQIEQIGRDEGRETNQLDARDCWQSTAAAMRGFREGWQELAEVGKWYEMVGEMWLDVML
jgi:hypothetical protein